MAIPMGDVKYKDLLSEKEQEIWDRVTQQITLDKSIYGESLKIYCQQMAVYEKCMEDLNGEGGFTQFSDKGWEQQRPQVAIAQGALKTAVGLAHKLGFDPSGTRKNQGAKTPARNNQRNAGKTPLRKVK